LKARLSSLRGLVGVLPENLSQELGWSGSLASFRAEIYPENPPGFRFSLDNPPQIPDILGLSQNRGKKLPLKFSGNFYPIIGKLIPNQTNNQSIDGC
jgi:hypothetical protein